LAIHPHFARKDQRLSLLARFDQSALNQRDIQTLFPEAS
jgi:hypothetical protein